MRYRYSPGQLVSCVTLNAPILNRIFKPQVVLSHTAGVSASNGAYSEYPYTKTESAPGPSFRMETYKIMDIEARCKQRKESLSQLDYKAGAAPDEL